MSLDSLIIFAGAVAALLPFLGFPSSWDHAILFILGLCIIALGIAVRRRFHRKTDTRQLPFDDAKSQDR